MFIGMIPGLFQHANVVVVFLNSGFNREFAQQVVAREKRQGIFKLTSWKKTAMSGPVSEPLEGPASRSTPFPFASAGLGESGSAESCTQVAIIIHLWY